MTTESRDRAALRRILSNAEFADGLGTILTHDAEEAEAALALPDPAAELAEALRRIQLVPERDGPRMQDIARAALAKHEGK